MSFVFPFRGSNNFVISDITNKRRKDNARVISCEFVIERIQGSFKVDIGLCSKDCFNVVSLHLLLLHVPLP